MLGTTELILLGGLALLVFGGKKVPEMMRGLGQGVKEFKKGMREDTNESDSNSNSQNSTNNTVCNPPSEQKEINNNEQQ